jgi:hypothetical protein
MPKTKRNGSCMPVAFQREASSEDIEKHGLSLEYKPRPCKLCGGCSLDINPMFLNKDGSFIGRDLIEAHPDYRTWGTLDPWGGGTKYRPSGFAHRLCLNAFHDGGYADAFGSSEADCFPTDRKGIPLVCPSFQRRTAFLPIGK